jgi:hypothetical protein
VRRPRELITTTIRSVRLIARDRRIPRPLRWLLALSLLPIPGPFDEAILLLAAPALFTFYRQPVRDAWRDAKRSERAPD